MIYPGAVWRPGKNAGYAAGRNRMQLAVAHYTVGRDSTAIGDRGYFHWLIGRDGTITQFAEADAITFHAGTANQWGPGIEVEYLPSQDDDLWTPAAYKACAGLVEWLIGLGIPDAFYDGDRINPAGFSGFITHRSVLQPDAHSDWWPDLPRAETPVPPLVLYPQEPDVFFMSDGKRNAAVTEYSVFQVGPFHGVGFVSVDAGTFDEIARQTAEKRKSLTK